MASTHKSLRSSTTNKRPTTAIADGQIALNTNSTSPGLFFKDSTGATIIKVGPVHVGATAPNVSPAAGGSAGNSTGEVWLDTSLTPVGVKIWSGSAWVNATPAGSTTVQGLLELATDIETQTGSDTARAVTPAGLQSKISDSTSTTSSTTIASSTAVKSAYDLANAALPKSGGTITGNLEIGIAGSLTFEGSTADAYETTLAVVDPTADRTITLPDITGTVITTGDTGTVTSTMIAEGTIVDGDISAAAEIAVSKLADGAARQLLQTDTAGTGVEWTSNVDIPGTLDVTGAANFDSTIGASAGAAATPSITFTGDADTGLFNPGANELAISTNALERARVDTAGRFLVGTTASINNVFEGGIQVAGTGQSSYLAATRYSATASDAPGIILGRSKSATLGTNTIVAANDRLGSILFSGANGSLFSQAAAISASVDGTPGASNDMPGRLAFSTSPDGLATPTERLRITSTGQVRLYSAGITFNGATAAENELDDYEEGTWTPTYQCATGAFTSITYDAITAGDYVKVGRNVFCSFIIRTDAITLGTAAGAVTIEGLPYVSFVTTSSYVGTVNVPFSLTFLGDAPNGGIVADTSTAANLYYKATSNGNSVALNVTDLGTGANANYIIGSISYIADL